jgi:hypothetical protein
MPFRFRRGRQAVPDARRRQVVGQAVAVLAKLREEGQPPAFIKSLEPFVELAPEVLALGPAPASLTMRVLYGLSVFEGEARQRFEQTLQEEFAGTSPTLRAVLRSGLVELGAQGQPRLQEPGRELYRRLHAAGAFSDAD